MKKTSELLLATLLCATVGCSSDEPTETTTPVVSTEPVSTKVATPEASEVAQQDLNGYGSTISVSGMDLTFGDTVEWYTEDYSGDEFFKVPAHMINNGEDGNNLNIFYINWYDPTGNGIDSHFTLQDDDLSSGSGMLSGAETDGYLYVSYLGDGTYTLITNDFDNEFKLEFEVVKPAA